MTTPNEQIKPPAEPSLRYLSVCSGMEAASVAWEPLGFVPVGFSEIEPFPCAILKHRFPNTTNYGSLTEHHTWPIEQGAIDLLVGGTPCQSFSVAGLRKGLTDPRGNLALTFLGLADRLKPKWILWENVPGVLSSNGGRDFGAFLGALVELGYGFAYRVLDAQHFGVPQRRRRVFVVACLGDWRAPAEVLSLSEGLLGYIEKGKQKRKGVATDASASVGTGGLPIWRAGDQANAEHMIDHAGTVSCNKGSHGGFIAQPTIGTLCARDYKGVGNQYVQEGKCIPCPALTPFRKSKRAQSVTDDESWVADGKANTLNNFDLGDTRTTHAVVQPIAWTQNQREEVRLLGDKVGVIALPGTHQTNYIAEPVISPTITTCKGSRGGCSDEAIQEITAVHLAQQPIPLDLRNATRDPEKHDEVNRQGVGVGNAGDPAHTLTKEFCHGVAQPIAIQGTIIGRGDNAGPQGVGASEGGPMYTLTKTDVHGVLYENHPNDSRVTGPHDVAPTVVTRFGTGGGNVPLVQQDAHVAYCAEKAGTLTVGHHSCAGHQHRMGDNSFLIAPVVPMAVRRLTPVECERLQGFPDNWSRIPWKGKTEEQCPDGPRYKACGNSMAVPVMRWIGERIKEIDANLPK
jgi:DNA (cytosine-5)-methyltransferase 1